MTDTPDVQTAYEQLAASRDDDDVAYEQTMRWRGRPALGKELVDEFPWIRPLPAHEVEQFCFDVVRGALAAAEGGQWQALEQTVREWKATALIYADPPLAEQLRTPVAEDHGSVSSPPR